MVQSAISSTGFCVWPRLRDVPVIAQGAGRLSEDTLGPHRQVFLFIVGQARARETERLLTLMIGVCFPPTPRICFQANVPLAVVLTPSSKGDRQSLCGQMVIRSNNEYLQVSEATLPGKDAGVVAKLRNKMSPHSSDVVFSYAQL